MGGPQRSYESGRRAPGGRVIPEQTDHTEQVRRCRLCKLLESEAEPGKCYRSQDMDHIWEPLDPEREAKMDRADEALKRLAHTEQPAIEGKYGEIRASKKEFHPGEPIFLLRSTDPYAPAAILDYAARCERGGCEPAHVDAARRHASRIIEWQLANRELVNRLPD